MEATSSVVEALKALADPVRLSILEFLWGPAAEEFRDDEDGICAKDIERFLGVTQPTVSYHMKILVGAGLVRAQKSGQKVYYECVTEAPDEVAGDGPPPLEQGSDLLRRQPRLQQPHEEAQGQKEHDQLRGGDEEPARGFGEAARHYLPPSP